MTTYILIFSTALLSSLVTVPILRAWAFQWGVFDHPGDHKIHQERIPRLGGVAIFLSFQLSFLLFSDISPTMRGILAGSLIVITTGLIDDLFTLSPKEKFIGEILATSVTIWVGKLYLTNLGDLFGLGQLILPPWLGIPFTIFAVVGVINAINLIDGLDGLSGGVAVIALCGIFALAEVDGNRDVALGCAALIGATMGFLRYNFHPAKIFMGDVGSLLLGFVLAFFSVHLTQNPQSTIQPTTPVILLGLPIFDALLVMGQRIYSGYSPFRADRTHIHHKLMALGLSHRKTVLFIYAVSGFWVTAGVLLRHLHAKVLLLVFAVIAMIFYYLIHDVTLRFQAKT